MDIPEYVAQQTERMGENYCHSLSSPRIRIVWTASGARSGATHIRNILEQVAECVNVNHTIAALLRGEPPVVGQLTVLAGGEGACERLGPKVSLTSRELLEP